MLDKKQILSLVSEPQPRNFKRLEPTKLKPVRTDLKVGVKDGLQPRQDLCWVEEGEHLAEGVHEPHTLPRVEAAGHGGPVDGVDDLAGVGPHAVRAVARDVLQGHRGRQAAHSRIGRHIN